MPVAGAFARNDCGPMTGQTMTHAPLDTPIVAAPLRLGVHLLVGLSIGIISPFTALAWPFALAVGILLGSADAKRQRGERDRDRLGRELLVVFGVLAMLIFGAIVGGVIAFAVVALASFSEKAAAHASPTDRGVARILIAMIPLVLWMFVFPLIGMDVDIRFGS